MAQSMVYREYRIIWESIMSEMRVRQPHMDFDKHPAFEMINTMIEEGLVIFRKTDYDRDDQKKLVDIYQLLRVLFTGIVSVFGLEVKLELPRSAFFNEMKKFLDLNEGE